LASFADGCGFSVEIGAQASYVGAEVIRRAASRLGKDDYHLLTNNCEHFCTWCLSGQGRSKQVEALLRHPWHAIHALLGIFCAKCARRAGGSHVHGEDGSPAPWRAPCEPGMC